VSERQNRGVVLVAVLFTVAIMSVMVVAASALTRSGIADHELEQRRLATRLALRSGLESAKALIVATPPAERAYFEGAPAAMDLGGGILAEVTIRDAAGLPDLNKSELSIIEAVLRDGIDAAEAAGLSARIGEWRREASERAKAQAPSAPASPASDSANRQDEQPDPLIFLSVDQLAALLAPASAERLSGRLTVFSPAGLVNPLAASEDVLLAIPGFTRGDLATVLAVRKGRPANPEGQLQPMLARLKPFIALQDPTVFVIGVRLQAGPGIIAQSMAGAVVQAVEQGPLPFRTLAVSGL
jgi:hypothetical protein